jgi:S1-C subfamily serine protease
MASVLTQKSAHAPEAEKSVESLPSERAIPCSKSSTADAAGRANVSEDSDSKLFDKLSRSVFFVEVNRAKIDPLAPWKKRQSSCTGTGFAVAIDGITYLLTCAHVIIWAKTITLCRNGSSTKVQAEVEHVSHHDDMAILKVVDDIYEKTFWTDLQPFKLCIDYPKLRDKCRVAGYPIGGSNFCTTSGEVSRVTMGIAAHYQGLLPVIEISAPLNSGASGCPVLDANQNVLGIGFQGYNKASNIAHAIPAESIRRFIKLTIKGRASEGRPSLSADIAFLENKSSRDSLYLPAQLSGVRVCSSNPERSPLKTDDIILSINGSSIGNDGTVVFREPNERIPFRYAFWQSLIGDACVAKVWRKKEIITLEFQLQAPQTPLVPFIFDKEIPYFSFGPYVFSVLYGETLNKDDPGYGYFNVVRRRYVRTEGQQCVIALQPLAHKLTIGLDDDPIVVNSCNGVPIMKLIDLVRCFDDAKSRVLEKKNAENGDTEFLTLVCGDTDRYANTEMLVIPVEEALRAHTEVMHDFGIADDANKDIQAARALRVTISEKTAAPLIE